MRTERRIQSPVVLHTAPMDVSSSYGRGDARGAEQKAPACTSRRRGLLGHDRDDGADGAFTLRADVAHDNDNAPGGAMLSEAEEKVKQLNPNAKLRLFGQARGRDVSDLHGRYFDSRGGPRGVR